MAHPGTTYIGSQGHTVWDFGNGNNGNVYQISGTVCQCYCPIQGTLQCNLQDSLCTYDMEHSAKYATRAVVSYTPPLAHAFGSRWPAVVHAHVAHGCGRLRCRARFVGSGSMNGVSVNKYQWMEGIGPIPMNELYL